MQNKEFHSLLERVVYHWHKSAKAYTEYMENGKRFRYAEMLKVHNIAAKNLLVDNINIIPVDLRKDAEAIIEHYTIWSARWDDLKSKLDPGPDDEFVFENDHRFPKAAAQKIEAVFRDLT